MKKTLRNLLLVCLVITSLVAVALFAACGGKPVTYTVTLQYPDETPVADATVSFTKEGSSSSSFQFTDEDGKATLELPAATYNVTIDEGVPEGYEVPANLKVTKDKHDLTVTLIKKVVYKVNLVDEDGEPFAESKHVMLALCQNTGNCLIGSYADENGQWSYEAPVDDYKVNIQFDAELEGKYAFDGSLYGHYYTGGYFNEENTENELTIVIRRVSTQLILSMAGTKTIEILAADDYAIIKFIPEGKNATGKYAIYSAGDYDTSVKYSTSTNEFYFAEGEDDNGAGDGKNFKLENLQIQEVGQGLQFQIYVKDAASYPVTFNVTIERTGDADPVIVREYEKITAAEINANTTKFANAAEGTAYKTLTAAQAENLVKGADNFYHIGSADGDKVVAKLSGFSDQMESSGALARFIDPTDATKGYDYIEFWQKYNKLTNADGVYPLNEELKTMLERYAAHSGNNWYSLCGYYAEGSGEVRDDEIIGEYEYENKMLNQSSTLTVNADGTYTMDGTTGTWKNNGDGTYTFTEDDEDWGEIYIVTRNSATGSLAFYYEGDGTEGEPEFVYEVKE